MTADRAERSRLTIRDVAAAAGVSPATVSRALRGMQIVDPRTRERILAIAKDLQYSVSPTASRLASGRTGTIGIVTPFVGRWYFTEVFAGIEEQLKRHDVDLLIHATEEMTDFGPNASDRLRRRVDGALVIGMSPRAGELEQLAELDVPVVLLGASSPEMSSVTIDDYQGARAAVGHLVGLGHRRIGLLTGRELPTPIRPENDRLQGYLDVLAESGLDAAAELRAIGGFTSAGGRAAMTELLALPDPPTAVFAMSDEMAYGARHALALAGRAAGADSVGGDVALIGYDGHDLAEFFDLSTIAQPVRDLGRAAADLLMRQVSDPVREPEALVFPTELQVRGSTVGG